MIIALIKHYEDSRNRSEWTIYRDARYRGDNERHVALAQTARLAFESAVCEAARHSDVKFAELDARERATKNSGCA